VGSTNSCLLLVYRWRSVRRTKAHVNQDACARLRKCAKLFLFLRIELIFPRGFSFVILITKAVCLKATLSAIVILSQAKHLN
jgi:hypothetical protein